MKRIFVFLCILIATIGVAGYAVAQDVQTAIPLSEFPRSTLQIATPDARLHRFNIWIADDEVHREQGLMFIKKMPEDAGMLFTYEQPQRIGIWMKNTYIPLDIVFISANGRVASISENAKPLSLTAMEVDNVVAVLELNGGVAAKLNIHKGAIVMHPFFNKTAASTGAASKK